MHIFPDLYTSKLRPCATYLVLIGYFSWESYKLLDCETVIVYSRRSVYFDEESANLMKSPKHIK